MSTVMRTGILILQLLPSLASAELDCIVATREEGFDARVPGAQSVQRAARTLEAIVKRNAVFMAGNEPVRVRTTITYHGDRWAVASVITTAYNRKAWTGAGCEVSKFADRGGGLSDGQIAIYINDPDAMLGGQVGDSTLPARLAPKRIGEHMGHPLYARGDDPADTLVMLSAANELPWTPVTIAEALDWRERGIITREQDWKKQSANAGRGEAQLRAAFENMKKMDPAGAEKLSARMERDIERMRTDESRLHAQSNTAIAGVRAGFDKYRASFAPTRLQDPATISGEMAFDAVQRADDPKGRPIVKVDAARAGRDPRRITLLVIPQYSVRTDDDHEWQVASRNALDYTAVAAVLKD